MSDKREWFYPAGDGSESVGPLTTEQVAEKLRSGELRVDDYVWGTHFVDQDWRRIFELEELRSHLPVRQAPKPRMAPPARVKDPDDDDVTLVDNPIQREKDHPAIKGENTSPGFVKALAEVPASAPVEPEKPPEIERSARVPHEPISIPEEQRSIAAPTEDFVSEIEQTNPSIRFREMTLDGLLSPKSEPPATAPPAAPPPAPPVAVVPPPAPPVAVVPPPAPPVAVAPPPAPPVAIEPPPAPPVAIEPPPAPPVAVAPPPAPPVAVAPPPEPPVAAPPPPIPALPPLEQDTAFTFRPSTENTVLTQRPPDAVTQSLPMLPALDLTQLTQPTQPTETMPMPEPEPVAAPPSISAQDTAIIQRPLEQRPLEQRPLEQRPLEDDKTIPSVDALLGHVRAEEPPAPEPAPLPPVIATTPEPVSTINFTPVLEEPVAAQPPVPEVTESKPTQELRTNTQTKTPSAGTHMGGGRVSGTGAHMSTRSGNTNFGGGQKNFTPKQDAFHAPQTDDFKATHDEPGEYGTENAYRRYPRVPFNTEVIMRDDREYHRFRSIDISEKGVRIKVEDISLFTKGEEITITVRSAPGIGTFSCKGVVMRILRADEGPGYGIFFMQLNPNIRRRITQFVLDQMSARLSRPATRGGPAAA